MKAGVLALLSDAGIEAQSSERQYRPELSAKDLSAKWLKPRSIVEMLARGSRDLGFAGADWVAELGLPLVELLDTGLNPVRIVAAAPKELKLQQLLAKRDTRIATEYPQLTQRWLAEQELEAEVIQSHGATEVFPPEDADCIVDNTSSGATLRANGLTIGATLMESTTRLYAPHAALEDPRKKKRIEELVLLFRGVLDARMRVMLEANVQAKDLEFVVSLLPGMRCPTVSTLANAAGYAVRAAVLSSEVSELIPVLKAAGASDIVITKLEQIIP